MRNFKLIIEYDGTAFNGWQIQPGGQRTVQGQIEQGLNTIFHKKIRLTGSGRTDSGVHALGQVAHFKVATTKSPDEIGRAINGNVPEDIVIIHAQEADQEFHARFSARQKTYRYTILNRPARPTQQKNHCLHIPYSLNIKRMRAAAKALIGKKDFCCFMASDPALRNSGRTKNTVRHIKKLQIKATEHCIYIEITANGFLYKMVRNIVGTLLEVGSGKRSPKDIKQILRDKDRKLAGATAPARGLCLIHVDY